MDNLDNSGGTPATPETPTPPESPVAAGEALMAAAQEPAAADTSADLDTAPAEEATVNNEPRTNPNVVLARQIIDAKRDLRNVWGVLDLFARGAEAYRAMQAKLGDVEGLAQSAEGREWLRSASAAEQNMMESAIYTDSLRREKGDWGQFAEYENARLAPAQPELGGAGKKLTGQAAAMKLQAAMGLGATVQVPLWHSGIWISILAPTESDLLMLDQMIAEEKIEVGSKTGGLAFANEGVYIHHYLINFILNRIYQTTLNDPSPETLKNVIKLTDLYAMAMGLALTIYPTGYPLRIPCVSDPHKCSHVTEAHIHLARTFLVDRSSLTREQVKHMSNRKASYSVDEVKAYQRQGLLADGRTIRINDTLQIVLKSPTLQEHIQSGFAWVEEMQNTIEKALGPTVSLKEKNQFITQQAVLTNLRQYAHWVEKVVFNEEEYEGAESIDPILSMMSADNAVADAFFEGIRKFIDESVVAMIGIPTFPCPSCGTPMTPEESEHPEIIPLDPIKLFFVLMGHRIIRAKIAQTNS